MKLDGNWLDRSSNMTILHSLSLIMTQVNLNNGKEKEEKNCDVRSLNHQF